MVETLEMFKLTKFPCIRDLLTMEAKIGGHIEGNFVMKITEKKISLPDLCFRDMIIEVMSGSVTGEKLEE